MQAIFNHKENIYRYYIKEKDKLVKSYQKQKINKAEKTIRKQRQRTIRETVSINKMAMVNPFL